MTNEFEKIERMTGKMMLGVCAVMTLIAAWVALASGSKLFAVLFVLYGALAFVALRNRKSALEGRDERQRHLTLICAYHSRNLTLAFVFGLWALSFALDRPVHSKIWPQLILLLLGISEGLIRWGSGLSTEVQMPEDGATRAMRAVSGVVMIVCVALLGFLMTLGMTPVDFLFDRNERFAATVESRPREFRSLSDFSDEELKSMGIRRVPKVVPGGRGW